MATAADHIKEYDRRVKTIANNREKMGEDIKACAEWAKKAETAIPKVRAHGARIAEISEASAKLEFEYGQLIGDMVTLDQDRQKLQKNKKPDEKKVKKLEDQEKKMAKTADKLQGQILALSKELISISKSLRSDSKIDSV